MIIDEHITPEGELEHTSLLRLAQHLVLRSPAGDFYRLSDEVVVRVMRHYGRALDEAVTPHGEQLELADGAVLTRFQYRARVDASARDYLALSEPGRETIATLSQGVAAALGYLALRLADK